MNLSEIILRLERIARTREIPGTDQAVVAQHLNDIANELFRLSVKIRRGEA